MQNTATNLKALFIPEDIQSRMKIYQNECISIEKYSYSLQKSRRDNGLPYPAATSGSVLSVTMSIGSRNSIKKFYERLHDKTSPNPYTVVFDANFSDKNTLENYNSAFILSGYVIAVDEDYNSASEEGHENFTLTVRILITKLTIPGKTTNVIYG